MCWFLGACLAEPKMKTTSGSTSAKRIEEHCTLKENCTLYPPRISCSVGNRLTKWWPPNIYALQSTELRVLCKINAILYAELWSYFLWSCFSYMKCFQCLVVTAFSDSILPHLPPAQRLMVCLSVSVCGLWAFPVYTDTAWLGIHCYLNPSQPQPPMQLAWCTSVATVILLWRHATNSWGSLECWISNSSEVLVPCGHVMDLSWTCACMCGCGTWGVVMNWPRRCDS